jgi:hypothetical protein
MKRLYAFCCSLCKKKRDFITLCDAGDLAGLKEIEYADWNEGLLYAVKANQKEAVKYLVERGATELNRALELACLKNFYGIAEFLLEKGAKPIVGIRVSKSTNILQLLYRFENNKKSV